MMWVDITGDRARRSVADAPPRTHITKARTSASQTHIKSVAQYLCVCVCGGGVVGV